MKKVIFLLVAMICFAINTSAKQRYSVIVTTQINYVYYDENGKEVGKDNAAGLPQSFNECADTPDQARRQAEEECSTMCRRSNNKDEGKRKYNGKYYQCYSTREVYGSTVESLNQNC